MNLPSDKIIELKEELRKWPQHELLINYRTADFKRMCNYEILGFRKRELKCLNHIKS